MLNPLLLAANLMEFYKTTGVVNKVKGFFKLGAPAISVVCMVCAVLK